MGATLEPWPPARRRLLVIGTSMSAGMALADPEREAWPEIVRRALADQGPEVELVHHRLYVEMPGALAFFEGVLADNPADWVVLQATAFQLTWQMATNRLSRKLGWRVGQFARTSSDRLHWLARHTGRPGMAAWRTSVIVARKAIGAEGMAEYGPFCETYVQAIGLLARLEATETAVIGAGHPRTATSWGNPAASAMVDELNTALSAAAAEHRFPWIDNDGASPAGQPFDSTFVDLLHKDAAWHRGIAEAVLKVLEPRVAPADAAVGRL